MAERFKAHAWKACKGETLSWVRIPFSPPPFVDLYFLRKLNKKMQDYHYLSILLEHQFKLGFYLIR